MKDILNDIREKTENTHYNIIDIWVWPMRKRTDTTGLWFFLCVK